MVDVETDGPKVRLFSCSNMAGETTMSGSFWAYLGTSWMSWHPGESSLSYSSREVHALNVDTRESHLNISSSPNQMFHPKPRATLDFTGFVLL